MEKEQEEIWRKAGFLVMPQGKVAASEMAEPDFIWLGEEAAMPSLAEGIGWNSLYPKLFVVHESVEEFMPMHWRAYEQQSVFLNGSAWLIGSKLEDPLPTAFPDYFVQQKTADLAAVVYMTLLDSVFRETAEWCGHMSSVVGRM